MRRRTPQRSSSSAQISGTPADVDWAARSSRGTGHLLAWRSMPEEPQIERTLRRFENHADADAAGLAYYRSLTPEERLAIGLELVQGIRETHPRFERVYRVARLGESPVSCDWGVGVQSVR